MYFVGRVMVIDHIDQILGKPKAQLVLHLETLSCRSFSSSFPLPSPASPLTIKSWSRDLEQKMSTLTRMWVQFDIISNNLFVSYYFNQFICILSFQTIYLYLIMLPLTCNFGVSLIFIFSNIFILYVLYLFLISIFLCFLFIVLSFHSTLILLLLIFHFGYCRNFPFFSRYELPSVTLAWKSPLRATEELRSINQTGCFFSLTRLSFFDIFMGKAIILAAAPNQNISNNYFFRLGRFTRDGSLWENMVPFWTADNAQ